MAQPSWFLQYVPTVVYFFVYVGALIYVGFQPSDGSSAKSRVIAGLALHLVTLLVSLFINPLVTRYFAPDQFLIGHSIGWTGSAVMYCLGLVLIVTAVFSRSSTVHAGHADAQRSGAFERSGEFNDGNPYSR